MTNPPDNSEFEALLNHVRHSRGFDLTAYKRSSLMRRVNKRVQMLGIESYSSYMDYLEVHPEEFSHLFNTLLINVTSFFRDRTAWDYISSDIIPRILEYKEPGELIRVWSAGCASGQEAYTAAMAIAEVIGVEQFSERVKIYATDVDEEALSQARLANYLARDMGGLTPDLLATYFELVEDRYVFRKDLRRSLIFGRHDLIQDAPISKVDLLICRNTLMYFNVETQGRILSRFHFALQEGGFLFLGKAEMLLTRTNMFAPVDLKRRVFTKAAKLTLRDRLTSMTPTSGNGGSRNPLSHHVRLREAGFDSLPIACLIVDADGLVSLISERARFLFNLSPRDLGRPLQDLEVSYRPVELRSCIEQSYASRQTVSVREAAYQLMQGDLIYLEVEVKPLFDTNNSILGASITFTDVTRYKRLQQDLEHSNQELEMAYEELQSTNEELETTNEELQSSNEELETTNEELQSTNEELETMNEELQSTNEELQTVNEELQRRSSELDQTNAFLESILTSLRGGVVVVDRNLNVQIWNHKSEDLWGLRSDEALEHNFLNLDIGLPVEQLRKPIRDCLMGTPDTSAEVLLSAINRRGRSIQCHVTCTPLFGAEREIEGVILLMEERSESNSQ